MGFHNTWICLGLLKKTTSEMETRGVEGALEMRRVGAFFDMSVALASSSCSHCWVVNLYSTHKNDLHLHPLAIIAIHEVFQRGMKLWV
jgi:hypothetical protein